jgi:serine protease AprX
MSVRQSFTRSALVLAATSVLWAGVPAEAAPRARLDADLTATLARGAQSIDVIVHGTRSDVDTLASRYNLVVKKYLKSGAVFGATAGQLDALASDGSVDHLSADAPVHSSSLTTESIGADQVWSGAGSLKGFSGSGIGVALIDSGIDPRHASLVGRVVATRDFTGGDGSDAYGHGTHVGALIAGRAGQTADTAMYEGVAPGARLINLRVLDGTGSGRTSDVVEAIDWAIDNRSTYNIRVMNLSLGAPVTQSYHDDPLCEAVERAVSSGIVVVAAAGNSGVTKDGRLVFGSITSPGNDPSALTVGAVDMHDTPQRSDDTVAEYSSKGPTLFDLVIKPDLVAPGSRLVSAEAAGSYLATTLTDHHVAGSGANAYMRLSGTSMAAGVTSGAVALLLDSKPRLTPDDVKLTLQLTGSAINGEGLLTDGAGDLDVIAAILAVTSTKPGLPGSVLAGELVLPGGVALMPSQAKSSLTPMPSTLHWGGIPIRGATIVWGGTIIWASAADTIIWGSSADQSARGVSTNTIIWGSSPDTIIWGSHVDSSTIIWGSAADTIIWGSSADTIIWGS